MERKERKKKRERVQRDRILMSIAINPRNKTYEARVVSDEQGSWETRGNLDYADPVAAVLGAIARVCLKLRHPSAISIGFPDLPSFTCFLHKGKPWEYRDDAEYESECLARAEAFFRIRNVCKKTHRIRHCYVGDVWHGPRSIDLEEDFLN